VDPIAGLDEVEKRKFLTLPGLEPRPLDRPARSQSLYRLRSPGSLYVGMYRYRISALPGRVIAQADILRFLIAAARFRSQVRLYGICNGESCNGGGCFPPLPVLIPPFAPQLIVSSDAVYREQLRRC
jgi:hypothetical protein